MPKSKNKPRYDGLLRSRIYLGVKDGKKKYKYVYAKTQRELDKKVIEQKIKLGKGIDLTSERDNFGVWGERWLKIKKTEVSPGRYATYKARYNNLSDLCNCPISKIRTADIQDIILDCATLPSEITGKPYSKQTLSEIKNVAKQILQLAIDNRVIDYNCAIAVKIPQAAQTSKRRALTDEEQHWIVDTPHRAQTAAMIMMYAGLRRGELLALTWEDIDLDNAVISVTKSVYMINGKPVLKQGGKTSASTRKVYIPKVLVDYLSGIEHDRFSLVCPNQKNNLMSETAWKRLWASYLCELNLKYGDWKNCVQTGGKRPNKYSPKQKPMIIPQITAHWLRHTYATLLYMSGVDILTAKELMGHSDIKTTMSIYTHLDNVYKKQNISKLDDFLAKKIKTTI